MNRDTVSTKLAAGMDRWQATLEDMIHLRPSNNNVFKDYYWAQNGFDELRRYVKQGSDFSKELAAILQERTEAEASYAKWLAKLAAKLGKACKESVGSCADAWKHVAGEMDRRAELHRNYSTALSEELVKPMKNVIDSQSKLRKKIEGGVDKSTRALAEWRAAEARAKKHSHAAARDNERLQDAAIDASRLARSASAGHLPHAHAAADKDVAKLQLKKRKTEDAVKKAEVDYYNVCVQAERARLEWETSVVRGAGLLEALEEERLRQLEAAAGAYLRLAAAAPAQLERAQAALARAARSASAAADMRVVRGVRAGAAAARAADQLLPDFYCEHTTLAMNRDRRKQALLKILQLVKQDMDRERKSKLGLEKLSAAIEQTPTFGGDDSQQNVADKLYHMRSMLTYLEAVRYKVSASLLALEGRAAAPHPLAAHIHAARDRQGLQQSVLKVPPWLQADYQDVVNKNQQPNYSALSKSVSGTDGGGCGAERDAGGSRASGRLRIEHTPCPAPPPPPPPAAAPPTPAPPAPAPASPLDWSERGTGDGLSNRHDSDFDEFSSQSDSSSELGDEEVASAGAAGSGAAVPAPARPAGKCRALYTYEARLNDELSLAPGDIIDVHDKQPDGWWSGELNGSRGIFPSSYVEEITTCI